MSGCLHEPALWPVANGERVGPDVADHLRRCARCSDQVVLLRNHRRELRAASMGQPPLISGAATEPVVGASPVTIAGNETSPPRPAATDGIRHGHHPTHIGRYAVERLLNLGGQAEVYLARHPAQSDRVVVKWAYAPITIEPHVADQFTEEARLLSEVRHPHLPRVHDLGLADNRPFLVLEYIRGETLAALGNAPWSSAEAAGLIAKVAYALHAVHEYGRLHLDIQPDNVVLGQDGEPRLIDFGMSQPRTAAARPCGGLVDQGTPEYLAPEQLAGDGDRIGVATDIYALGAVLHELLTGLPPQPEVVWGCEPAGGRMMCPGSRDSRLARICRRALQPDPQRRYRSARVFADELVRHVAGRSSSRLAVVGAAIAAGVAAWSAVQCWPESATLNDTCSATPSTSPASRRELVAGAIQRLLVAPDQQHGNASIILADGRVVPVSARPDRTSSPTEEFAMSIAAQLDGQQGTTLLLVAADPTSLPAPPLPSGTIAQITDGSISIIAPGTVAEPYAGTVVHALRGLQRRLAQRNAKYRALVLSTGAEFLPGETSSNVRRARSTATASCATGDTHGHDRDCPETRPETAAVLARRAGRTGPL